MKKRNNMNKQIIYCLLLMSLVGCCMPSFCQTREKPIIVKDLNEKTPFKDNIEYDNLFLQQIKFEEL